MSPRKRTSNAGPFITLPKKRRISAPSSDNLLSPLKALTFDTFSHSVSSPATTDSGQASSSSINKYTVHEDEINECDDLCELLAESDPAPGNRKTLPVRILTSFDIYDYESEDRKVLPMEVDPDEDLVCYGASGFTSVQFQSDDEDEDAFSDAVDACIPVKLTAIQEVWTDKDEIWIRTHFAWYILEDPSESYQTYYNKMKALAQAYSRRPAPRPSRIKEPSTSFLTPRVGSIAQGLFLRSLLMIGERPSVDPDLQNVCVQDIPFVVHATDPDAIAWGEEIPASQGLYKSVFMDGVEYHMNDTVAVSTDGNGETAAGSSTWFGIIMYFYEVAERKPGRSPRSGKYFHIRWFEHGSRTILGETANPQALFLLDQCDDNPVETILQKISVRHLSVSDLEPLVISDNDVGSSSFHLSYKWDQDKMSLSAVDFDAEKSPKPSIARAYAAQPEYEKCYSCAVKDSSAYRTNEESLPMTLEIYDKHYHVNDFVYVKMPTRQIGLLEIAQIAKILPSDGNPQLEVTLFERPKYTPKEATPLLQRSLLSTGKVKKMSADCLDGHCFILRISDIDDIDAWLEGPDNFVIDQKRPLEQCQKCLIARELFSESEDSVKELPLRAMDLFSGAGGLTTGMDQSGFIKTCWAVERCPAAAQSLKANHADTVVYNQDCSELLKHVAELHAGKTPPTLRSLGPENEALPPLPSPGEVDLIMGGPPCQPFSGMNSWKRVDDIRQTCIPTVLSYVEFYSPKYVCIENVTGLLYYRLKGRQEGRRIVGGIESGMVKFVMRAFTSLGYQCQMKVLNAADYGSPQQRNRVIFWAARLDLALPKWPTQTHIPRQGHKAVQRRITNGFLAPLASRNESGEKHEQAPFYAVTIKEAIDDLPAWDWENPGIVYPDGARKQDSNKPTFPATVDQRKLDTEDAQAVSGYNYPVRYASAPRTLYQAFCRKGQGHLARVEAHCTILYPSLVVERTVNVPIKPLANFNDLPKSLKGEKAKGDAESKKDTYWRLDENEQFRTLMTSYNPGSKGACVIHPTDKRVLSARELARAQGFPDDYEFCPAEERIAVKMRNMQRQIGNAVPVHLAYALGRALGEGLIQAEIEGHLEEFERGRHTDSDVHSIISEEL
ncbi:S-adenosyl-L-methionine-dependent methyltransferase, partial [Fomitiporia mediterranea MF3/22]|uniref:S-adenosyl-L-methionine-dependent methyltransferase n=1 Tax=Fomitiporia mediterranea (strain MF3/22) TaxID=694068 RepID=UPI0004408C79